VVLTNYYNYGGYGKYVGTWTKFSAMSGQVWVRGWVETLTVGYGSEDKESVGIIPTSIPIGSSVT
jgi:hypothetical protein